jgi:uncharacterized protein YbcI
VSEQPQTTETLRDDPGVLDRSTPGEQPGRAARALHLAPDTRPPTDGGRAPEMLGRGRLLAAISTTIVAILRQGYGRGPTKAKTYAQDDMIIVVMRDGGYTPLERTMLADGGRERVAAMRHNFQSLIAERYKQAIRDLTGRDVLAIVSQTHVDPDITTEIFFLDRPLDDVQPTLSAAPQSKEHPVGVRDAVRNIPGIAAAEAAITGALATASDLPITDYDQLTAADIASRQNTAPNASYGSSMPTSASKRTASASSTPPTSGSPPNAETQVRIWSSSNRVARSPRLSLHSRSFSTTQANKPTGESLSPYDSVTGRVRWWCS